MDIIFRNRRIERICNSDQEGRKALGAGRAKRVRRRLDELDAADTLDVMKSLPQARCHELKGDRKGQLSVDLDHPYRLIFEVANEPTPRKPDGGLDWTHVTAIRILEVGIDYHG